MKIHSITGLHKKARKKFQINNLTLYLKEPEKEQVNLKVSRRKKIIKSRAEMNEVV